MSGIPARHVLVHENTLARVQGVLAALRSTGDLSELDYESIVGAIDAAVRDTERRQGIDMDAPMQAEHGEGR